MTNQKTITNHSKTIVINTIYLFFDQNNQAYGLLSSIVFVVEYVLVKYNDQDGNIFRIDARATVGSRKNEYLS